MFKLSRTVSPTVFWVSVTAAAVIGAILILINYRIAIINSASAAEADYVINHQVKADIISCDCEQEFTEALPVVWSGRVLATFSGGEDLAIENNDLQSEYRRFYVVGAGLPKAESGADVRVNGRLTGITCAYANSVFGECVGEVVADEMKILSLEQ